MRESVATTRRVASRSRSRRRSSSARRRRVGTTTTTRQPSRKVKGAIGIISSQASILQRSPVRTIDGDFVVPVSRLPLIGQNLPVHPRNTSVVHHIGMVADVLVSGSVIRNTVGGGALLVGSVVVARTPFLDDDKLAVLLGLGDGAAEVAGLQIASVGVDGDDVDGGAVEVFVEDGYVKVAAATGGDEDVS